MNKNSYLSFSLAFLALCLVFNLDGCHGVFTPDPKDPRLPAYTESGNDVSGVLVNGVAWRGEFIPSFDMPVPKPISFTNYAADDSTTMTLYGKYIEGPDKGKPVSFVIGFRGLNIRKTEDVMSLNGKTFLIDNINTSIRIGVPTQSYLVNGTGSINIRKVKIINNVTEGRDNGNGGTYHPVIIAGVFQFDFKADKIKIESGRFDFAIDDFYIDNK